MKTGYEKGYEKEGMKIDRKTKGGAAASKQGLRQLDLLLFSRGRTHRNGTQIRSPLTLLTALTILWVAGAYSGMKTGMKMA